MSASTGISLGATVVYCVVGHSTRTFANLKTVSTNMPYHTSFSSNLIDCNSATDDRLRAEQHALYAILLDLEPNFSFHRDVVVRYPKSVSDSINDPVNYLARCIYAAELLRKRHFASIVVLSTCPFFKRAA